MTLQEVLNQIPEAAKVKRVPSVVKLAAEGIPVLADQLDADTSVVIYSNGYVVYQSEDRRRQNCRAAVTGLPPPGKAS